MSISRAKGLIYPDKDYLSTLRTVTIGSSETLVHVQQTTRHWTSEHSTLHSHCRKDLKCHLFMLF